MTPRERHPARGVILLVVAAFLTTVIVLDLRAESGSDVVWLVTVIPALTIATLLTAANGFFDLYGRTTDGRKRRRVRKDTP